MLAKCSNSGFVDMAAVGSGNKNYTMLVSIHESNRESADDPRSSPAPIDTNTTRKSLSSMVMVVKFCPSVEVETHNGCLDWVALPNSLYQYGLGALVARTCFMFADRRLSQQHNSAFEQTPIPLLFFPAEPT